ncbi:glycoside hydrolase family 31 protein [Microbacter margulisiae]|uniref:Alpha-glucosidase (Family GH31 glycosyl hydrolase) n=1 Tax=Microbacter margulisiae TaxID=1350067 RepID=A0A7W5DT87_9PORP|nr:TIM-barrel domain-containing protein [Microbacter margulisiae]MBB3188651.1 alpha-glucosidase (family GH31 glycosyl hydrolase) [Microbacter margulisiae]
MKSIFICTILFLCVTFLHAQQKPNEVRDDRPTMIVSGAARFTLLTSHIIRMEYDSTGRFVNAPSFVVIHRDLPAIPYTQINQGQWLIIKTSTMELKYKIGSGKFNQENLQITYKQANGSPILWHPGMANNENLKGTFRTLDGMNGDTHEGDTIPTPFQNGLLSRNGWYLLDDSNNFLFDNSSWRWVKKRNNPELDWYFMGYGTNYKAILYDFTKIAGKIPLPPRYAFGYWWSRYWNYSDDELRTLVEKFKQYNIPLDVLIIDMDWHTAGWTGYTWNKSLFPDPEKFLQWLKGQHLKTALNLHPASGIAPTEAKYTEFAKAMSFDTTGHKNIPFECADKKYMSNLFNIVLNPLRKEGVDFWWLDWQQWPYSKEIAGLSNTWWLNYCFFTEMEQQTNLRPLLYHRWGGLGNHRYQIGFSGDVVISWKSLAFQPYFTATASNVLYGYWSHDLGGHWFGNVPDSLKKIDPEMYTRWMQYGVFSPIFRTHSTKDPRLNRVIWNFTGDYFNALYNAIHLRYALAPYIYTMSRKAYDTGISLCRPMYYDYPQNKEAYALKDEYMFGDNMLIKPVVTPAINGLSTVKVWLPAGNDWYEWSTGTLFKGGQIITRKFMIDQYPVYVKAGAIIPMYDDKVKNLQENSKDLIVKVFPGSSFSTRLYEDAGNNNDYQKGAYTFTKIQTEKEGNKVLRVTIYPRTGAFSGMIHNRNIEVQLYGSVIPDSVVLNGRLLSYNTDKKNDTWNYSGHDLTVHIRSNDVSCNSKTEFEIYYPSKQVDINGMIGEMHRLKKAVAFLKNSGSPIPDMLSGVNQTDIRIEYHPTHFNRLIHEFAMYYPQVGDLINQTIVNPSIAKQCSYYLYNY